MPESESNPPNLDWARAASFAAGQSMGPWAHGVPWDEAERIDALAQRINDVGEDEAWAEYRLNGETR